MQENDASTETAAGEPENRARRYESALARISDGQFVRAVEILDTLIAETGGDADSYYARGVAHMSSGNYRQAGGDFLRAAALDREFLSAYKNLGFVQLTMGREEDALKTLGRALEIDPEYVDAYCLLGDVHLDLGEYDKARAMIEKALELDPGGAEPHCKMAMYHLSMGDFPGLRKEYEILRTLHPSLASQIGGLFFSGDE